MAAVVLSCTELTKLLPGNEPGQCQHGRKHHGAHHALLGAGCGQERIPCLLHAHRGFQQRVAAERLFIPHAGKTIQTIALLAALQ